MSSSKKLKKKSLQLKMKSAKTDEYSSSTVTDIKKDRSYLNEKDDGMEEQTPYTEEERKKKGLEMLKGTRDAYKKKPTKFREKSLRDALKSVKQKGY